MTSFSYAALLALAGAAVLLDKWAVAEFGVSQPIVSCPLLGLLFGDPLTGLFLGTALQLVWVDALPLGGDRPPDYQAAGVTGITCYLFARHAWLLRDAAGWPDVRNRVLFACLILAGLATIVGQVADDRVKQFNGILYRKGMAARTPAGVVTMHLLGLVTSYVRGVLVTFLFLLAVFGIGPLLGRLPPFTTGELLFLPLGIGIAGLLKLFYRRERIPLMLAGALASGVLWIFLK